MIVGARLIAVEHAHGALACDCDTVTASWLNPFHDLYSSFTTLPIASVVLISASWLLGASPVAHTNIHRYLSWWRHTTPPNMCSRPMTLLVCPRVLYQLFLWMWSFASAQVLHAIDDKATLMTAQIKFVSVVECTLPTLCAETRGHYSSR